MTIISLQLRTGGGKALTIYYHRGKWHLGYQIMGGNLSSLPRPSAHVDFDGLPDQKVFG